uniref:NUDIX hydrolase n=1 Tax=Flavobacterium sp. TaxID=239 RepID=UPI00404A3A3F
MLFHQFLEYVPKIQIQNLLGEVAHAKMAPFGRMDLVKQLNPSELAPKKAAVLILCYPKNEQTHLVLIVRNEYPGVHASQIAFPGGKPEPEDRDLIDTAFREAEEEVGIPRHLLQLVRPFSDIYIPPSNYLVTPVFAYSNSNLTFVRQPSEVADILEFPIADLLDDAIVVNEKMKTSYAVSIDVPAFKINGHLVWGATAMMLSEFKESLKNVL